jgi:hypothetical protein
METTAAPPSSVSDDPHIFCIRDPHLSGVRPMTASPLPLPRVVSLVDDDTYVQWIESTEFSETVVTTIDVVDILDRSDLFDRAHTGLELPAGVGLRSWSGLEDYLWSAVSQHEGTDATIAIRHVDSMLSQLLGELLELVGLLTDVAGKAATTPADDEHAPTVWIVLTGDDLNFPMQPTAP